MSIFQWQSNDSLSTYNSSSGKVLSGTANLSTPPSALFSFFEDFGKSLRRSENVLSPKEALEIKLGFGAKYTATNQGIWKIVDERLTTEPNLRARYQSLLPSLSLADRELDTRRLAQLSAERQVASIESYFSQALSQFCRNKVSPNGAPSEITNRFRRSTFDGVNFEQGMQVLLNASTTSSSNPNVFSLMGDGKTPDPVVDLLASVFCRVLQNPSEPAPNYKNVGGSREQQWVLDMEKGALSSFYPAMNLSAIPAGYPQIKPKVDNVRGLVVQARTRAARLAASTPNVFGSTQVLTKMFEQGSPAFKMGMMRVFYPWIHRSDAQRGLSDFSKKESQYLIFTVGDLRMRCLYRDLLHTMYLLDYLSAGPNELRKHTVNYLAWVKRKCVSQVLATKPSKTTTTAGQIISSPTQSLVKTTKSPFASSLATSLIANRLPKTSSGPTPSSPTIPSLPVIPSPSLPVIPSPSAEPEVIELDTFEDDRVPVSDDIDIDTFESTLDTDTPDHGDEEVVILQQQEGETPSASAAQGIDPKFVYIGSAAAIALAVGAYIVVKKSRQQI